MGLLPAKMESGFDVYGRNLIWEFVMMNPKEQERMFASCKAICESLSAKFIGVFAVLHMQPTGNPRLIKGEAYARMPGSKYNRHFVYNIIESNKSLAKQERLNSKHNIQGLCDISALIPCKYRLA